jgi:hypothetical protein
MVEAELNLADGTARSSMLDTPGIEAPRLRFLEDEARHLGGAA